MLDFDNPEFFAETFSREKGELFMREWTELCLAQITSNTINTMDVVDSKLLNAAKIVGKVELTAAKEHAIKSFAKMLEYWSKNS